MPIAAQNPEPPDAAARRAVKPVTVYSLDRLPSFDHTFYETVRTDLTLVQALTVPPRDARAFEVPVGHLFRIITPEGSQVGDLNLWNAADLRERFYSGKTRALAAARNLPLAEAETHVHDVVNVFMCTGYSRDINQYVMKASPSRAGDFIELFAEIDLLGALSSCPGGDCGSGHSSDDATCHPLRVEIHRPRAEHLASWQPSPRNGYSGSHGVD